jgi:hypothetical protein
MTVEVVLVKTDRDRQDIYLSLTYRKKTRGRTIMYDIPRLGVSAGYRLEPSATLPDVGKFEMTPTPFFTHFWCADSDARVQHESPILAIEGVTLRTWCIDLLHSWHLGPLASYIGHCLHFFIASRIWSPDLPFLDAEEMQKLSLLHIKSEIWQYYKNRRATDKEWTTKGSQA